MRRCAAGDALKGALSAVPANFTPSQLCSRGLAAPCVFPVR